MSFILKLKDSLTGQPYEVESIEERRNETYASYFGVPMCMPLKIKRRSDGNSKWWLLPWEPYITVQGKNIIIKRNVAKATLGGSIKERWATDDYDIKIEGYFFNPESSIYPKRDVSRLSEICEAAEPIDVWCELFEAVNITSMVIESWEFPFTKGESSQDWVINGCSDKSWDLLIKEEVITAPPPVIIPKISI